MGKPKKRKKKVPRSPISNVHPMVRRAMRLELGRDRAMYLENHAATDRRRLAALLGLPVIVLNDYLIRMKTNPPILDPLDVRLWKAGAAFGSISETQRG